MQDQALRTDRHSVGLSGTGVEVDAVSFQDLVASGTPADLEKGVSLYRGDLLDGLDLPDPGFQAWLEDERRRFHGLMVEALDALMAHKRADGAPKDAFAVAQRLLALDPCGRTSTARSWFSMRNWASAMPDTSNINAAANGWRAS